MITKEMATALSHGRTLYHLTTKNRDGSPVRCRINGQCKTWASRPADFRLPVKYGLRECFYITPDNAWEWTTREPSGDTWVLRGPDSDDGRPMFWSARHGFCVELVSATPYMEHERETVQTWRGEWMSRAAAQEITR